MDGVVEIITGRERRRRWSTTDKLRLVAETEEAGVSVRGVAASHGICESLLFTWRRQVRQGTLVAEQEVPMFQCVAYARAHRHPELRDQTVWSVFEAERPSLVPYVGRFA